MFSRLPFGFVLLVFVLVVLGVAATEHHNNACERTCVRKEIRTLSHQELFDFTSAMLELNQRPGNYYNEKYPITHFNFVTAPPVGASVHDTNFLPWHRYFLRSLELDLQSINPSICLPYWNWTLDSAAPADSPVFKPFFFGSGANSTTTTADCITDGPYVYQNWKIPQPTPDEDVYCKPNYGLNFTCQDFPGTTCLSRNYFGSTHPTTTPAPTTTPSVYDENDSEEHRELIGIPNGHGCIISSPAYLPPYTSVSEVMTNTQENYMFWSNGLFCSIHNSVHRFIGGAGGQMSNLLSPSDPIFFLHHGYLDLIFSKWQQYNISYGGNTFVNNQKVPVNFTDILFPFGYSNTVPLTESTITVESVWNIEDLCYSYDE